MKYEPQAAAAVIGLAGFQLLQAWNANAPTLADVRAAPAGDVGIRQQLMDANFLVGGMAVILGTTFAVMTKDATALFVMLAVYGGTAVWYSMVCHADAR